MTPPDEITPVVLHPLDQYPNRVAVENVGLRIRTLRESRGITQFMLQTGSRVSRSYLSRIESGQMTPSLGTLERIGEALGLGLRRFFLADDRDETAVETPFVQTVMPYVRGLTREDREAILRRLYFVTRPSPAQLVKTRV